MCDAVNRTRLNQSHSPYALATTLSDDNMHIQTAMPDCLIPEIIGTRVVQRAEFIISFV